MSLRRPKRAVVQGLSPNTLECAEVRKMRRPTQKTEGAANIVGVVS